MTIRVDGRQAARRGFTLAELLAVIVIMIAIMAIAVPSFSGLMRAGKVDKAVAQVQSILSLARQWAITQASKTYVVFPAASKGGRSYRSYAVLEYNAKYGGIRYLRDWMYLPEGVVFVPNQAGYGTATPRDTKNIFTVTNNTKTLAYPYELGAATPLVCIAFYADGSVDLGNGVGPFELFFAEGWHQDTNANPAIGWAPLDKRQLKSIEVHGITGRIQAKEYPLGS